MGWFKKQPGPDPEEIVRLKSEIAIVSARLAASDQQKQELDNQIRTLAARLDAPIAPPPTAPPPAPGPRIDPAEIDMLNAKIERLAVKFDALNNSPPPPPAPATDPEQAARVEQLDDRVHHVTARLDEIDQRITAISTELANQLSELSTDLDTLGSVESIDDGTLDELRDAQTRLAEEQARYQIAFRKDLADLADRLRPS